MSGDPVPPPANNSFTKILSSPCRNCDPREMFCDGGHTQTPPAASAASAAAFSGDLIPRQCTCRGFDRPAGPRRIPVANVQPFRKEPADAATALKSSVDAVQSTLEEDVQKVEDPQTDSSSSSSSAVTDDTIVKEPMVTTAGGPLKMEHQTVGWTSGDTPHLKEFVKFLENSAANPFRTPDEKLCESLGRGGGTTDSTVDSGSGGDDRGRVKRQLLLHLGSATGGPKGRTKPTGLDAKREGGLVVGGGGGGESKRTPVEYIDEDNCVEPMKGKEKETQRGDTVMMAGKTSTTTTADSDESALYGGSALYQTMKALDRQAEDRVKASLLLGANSTAASPTTAATTFSLSKTDTERKEVQATSSYSSSSPDGGAICVGANRASDRPTTDVMLEQRKKKKKKKMMMQKEMQKEIQKVTTNADEAAAAATEQLATQRTVNNTTSNIGEQRSKDAQKELASASTSVAASATGERAASEADGGDSFVASSSALDVSATAAAAVASSAKPATKRKYQRKKNKQEELPGSGVGNQLTTTELTGNKSSTTSMSSSESTEVTPKKKRRRAIELLTQFNPPDESRDIDENRLSRSATEFNASATSHSLSSSSSSLLSSSTSSSSSSSILLQVPQFLQQTPVESSTGKRRGTSVRRDGSIVRHARRPSNYDRNAAYEAELTDEAERRLVRRGHGRGGCRAAARHQHRMLGQPHRLSDAELRGGEAPSASYDDDGTNQHHHYQQQQQQAQSQRVDDETTRDLFEYDDSSDAIYPSRRGRGQGQGRKPVRKNPGRIAFQYPEVFGRRRARGGGLRGRSRPVRGSSDGGGAGTAAAAGAWNDGGLLLDHNGDPKDFERDRTRNDGGTIGDAHIDPLFNTHSINHQLPTAAAATATTTTSIRGKVRSRVRVCGRGSRGHSRAHSAPRYDPVAPPPSAGAGATTADSRPCPSGGVGRDSSETRLHQVTRLGYEELVSYYLTTGIIHPNVQDNSGVTPLHDSCSHGYLNITRLLLDHGAHPNCKDLDGTRPLHLAVANDHIEIVRLLLSFGADVTMTDVTGRSPLQVAKTRDMKQMLKGFASDLSGGKGKEIPWQFPALFETGVCDVLADAPADDPNDDAADVIFDLGTDSSLPVHRFVSDSQKGPRNFHSVSDLCEDVKVDDFLLLNGDLTYVHVTSAAAAAADLSSSTDAASTANIPAGHSLPGPSSSSSSSSSLSSLDHHLPSLSLGASTSSSVSFTNHQQQQQPLHRGWMPLSSSSRPRTYCSSATGADRSSFVEIDASLKGLLDIGVHRVRLHFRSGDVTWPSSGRFFSRRKAADNSRTVSGNRVSSAPSLAGSSSVSLSSSSVASATLLHASSKSELAIVTDCTTTTTTTSSSSASSSSSGVEKSMRNCETGNEHNTTKLESKKKLLNRPVSPPGPSSSSSLPTARPTPLCPADPKGESGNSRGDTLDECRIVLCDINGPSLNDLNSMIRTCDAIRKDFDRTPTTVIHHRPDEERDDRKKMEQRKQTVHNNEHQTGSVNSLPVRSTSVIDKTIGCLVRASKDMSSASLDISVPIAASQRSSLGSSERAMVANGSSSSGTATAVTVPLHQRPSVLSNARRRAVPRELFDGGVVGSKPEAAPQSESLIPVLEKHGSDDETPPVENEEDVCGESYDDEREMPQLTLYA